jgi:phenylpropionate dioxygenase-like ring-hydroxylating dioxygenase large terminal subunit
MNKTVKRQTPETWDRRGLPAWTYHSQALFDLERTDLFLNHWQIAGHVSDIPGPGDWLSFDFLDERALVIRDRDGAVRAFHNLCRHRGARLVDGPAGRCRSALVCPFHGWVYNTDGTLRGPSRPETFGDFDRADFGLKPVEMEIWNGFIFLRFNPGPQPAVKALFSPFAADFTAYGAADFLPARETAWTATLPVNWKSVRDVDNEGYHVAMAHPALQDLYGRSYRDMTYTNGISSSYAEFGDHPGRLWSVRHYLKIAPVQEQLPARLRRSWTYFGLFPNAVIAFTPESAQYYQEVPRALGETELRGRSYRRPNETRAMRLARYLAQRIDRETGLEDQQLSIWSNESMRSSAFDEFHLSDLEYGVRNHHDQIRRILPVTRLRDTPSEGEVAARNNDLLRAEDISV